MYYHIIQNANASTRGGGNRVGSISDANFGGNVDMVQEVVDIAQPGSEPDDRDDEKMHDDDDKTLGGDVDTSDSGSRSDEVMHQPEGIVSPTTAGETNRV